MKTPSRKKQTRGQTRRQKARQKVDRPSLSIVFSDKTQLNFDLEPGLTVRADHSDFRTGNYRGIKRWPRFHSDSFWTSEPGPPPEA